MGNINLYSTITKHNKGQTACMILGLHCPSQMCKLFPHYLPFVRGIHQSTIDLFHKASVMHSSDASFVIHLNKLLNRQSSCQWFQMPWCSCDITVMMIILLSLHISAIITEIHTTRQPYLHDAAECAFLSIDMQIHVNSMLVHFLCHHS